MVCVANTSKGLMWIVLRKTGRISLGNRREYNRIASVIGKL